MAGIYDAASLANPALRKKLAPASFLGNWHVPTDAEWTTLTNCLGGEAVAGGKMKKIDGWNTPNAGATNDSGFSGLPRGFRNEYGAFLAVGDSGLWWSASEANQDYAFFRALSTLDSAVFRGANNKKCGMSVRWIKN